jgi:dihydrofolate synthase/folylpolyglutamate synthase
MNDQDLLNWLEIHVGFESYQQLGGRSLERIRPFFNSYIEYFKTHKTKVVTIAGTNGKGQTSYSAAQLLKSFNVPYGLFISPHVHSVTERLQTHQGLISQDELYDLFLCIDQKQKKANIQLSFFEFLFACFLEMCLQKHVKVLVLEVGVGGRLDATNLFDADVAVITSIGRDHQDLLGNRLEQILAEKMGILRRNGVLFSSLSSKYLLQICEEKCREFNIAHTNITDNEYFITNRTLGYLSVRHLLPALNWNQMSLEKYKSHHQDLPGRGEVITHMGINYHLFGSHNLDGMRAWLKANACNINGKSFDCIYLAFSKRSWNDISAMIKLWAFYQKKYPQNYPQIVITTFSHQKAKKFEAKELQELHHLLVQNDQSIKWISNWKEHLRLLKIDKYSKNILIIGSFYFVSEFKSNLPKNDHEPV